MEKYLGYRKETIEEMICDRSNSIKEAVNEVLKYPSDVHLYKRARSQLAEMIELINELEFRNDEIIGTDQSDPTMPMGPNGNSRID